MAPVRVLSDKSKLLYYAFAKSKLTHIFISMMKWLLHRKSHNCSFYVICHHFLHFNTFFLFLNICSAICEVLGLSLSSSLPDSCIEFHSGSDFETANRDCQLTGKRLMTANELLSVTSEWIVSRNATDITSTSNIFIQRI